MSRVIAIFGAGPGLGASIARRFAAEGFRVALVARRKDRLDALVDQLAAEGIEAAGFTADLAAPDEIPAAVAAIRETPAASTSSSTVPSRAAVSRPPPNWTPPPWPGASRCSSSPRWPSSRPSCRSGPNAATAPS